MPGARPLQLSSRRFNLAILFVAVGGFLPGPPHQVRRLGRRLEERSATSIILGYEQWLDFKRGRGTITRNNATPQSWVKRTSMRFARRDGFGGRDGRLLRVAECVTDSPDC